MIEATGSFKCFQNSIADKTIANDNIVVSAHELARFAVADKIDAPRSLKQGICFLCECVPLALFGAVIYKTDTRTSMPRTPLIYAEPMYANWSRYSGVQSTFCAAVNKHHRPFERRKHGCESGTLNTRNAVYDKRCTGKNSTGASRRDKAIGFSVRNKMKSLNN